MNTTQRLIKAVEEVFRLSQLDYDGIDILVQRSAANQEVKEAIAAAKEEHGKHEICPPHVIYEAVGGGMICSGCEQRFAPAKGLDVDGVMKIVEREVLTHQRISETLRGIRKALEAHAEKGGDNLRKG